ATPHAAHRSARLTAAPPTAPDRRPDRAACLPDVARPPAAHDPASPVTAAPCPTPPRPCSPPPICSGTATHPRRRLNQGSKKKRSKLIAAKLSSPESRALRLWDEEEEDDSDVDDFGMKRMYHCGL
ncbi:hypothetical protein EJB05_23915, partial [Eragrostis curvula]